VSAQMADQELLPCPFCPKKTFLHVCRIAPKYSRYDTYRVTCKGCGVYGPAVNVPLGEKANHDKARSEAIEAWNRRASAPGLDREKLLAFLNKAFENCEKIEKKRQSRTAEDAKWTFGEVISVIDSGRFDAASRGADGDAQSKIIDLENELWRKIEGLENLIIFVEMFLARPDLDQEVQRRHLIGRIREAREALGPKPVASLEAGAPEGEK
jgi:Lar family restriction alleviation protein